MFQLKYHSLFLGIAICLGVVTKFAAQNATKKTCGDTYSKAATAYFKTHKSLIKSYEANFIAAKSSKRHTLKTVRIPIKIYKLVKGSTAELIDATPYKAAVAHLNSQFLEALIEFHLIDGITTIDTPSSESLKKGAETNLSQTHYTKAALNIYITDTLVNASNTSICGYVGHVPSKAVIVMATDCLFNASSLAHEVGHFLSLLHTHGTSNNVSTTELVDGSNCDTDGDGICDTPADPQLNRAAINNFCEYMGSATDINGDVFQPDTYNIMSYSRKACRSHFSKQQMARMFGYYQTIKHLFSDSNTKLTVNTPSTTKTLETVSVYPNPATASHIQITGGTFNAPKKGIQYQITNHRGQTISRGTTKTNSIKVSHLAAGSYVLLLENASSRVIKKIIR